MSKPWGIGAWAAEAEREEAEQKEQQKLSAAAAPASSFPSLKEANAVAKPKKKKGTAMTLSEFNSGTYVGPGGAAKRDSSTGFKGLTPDEMLRLPTGPKERSAEEIEQGRLGGGFRSFGRSGPGPNRNRGDDGGDGSWAAGGGGGRRSYGGGGGGGFDDDRRGSPRVSDFDQPSRADEVDNWASMKKTPSLMDSGRDGNSSNRYNSLGGGSKADEVDNWAIGKKPVVPSRATSFGSGFRDSALADSHRWSRGGGGGGSYGTGSADGDPERPRIVLDKPRGDGVVVEASRSSKPSPFGAARPREEILAEKGLDWRKMESEIETRKPTSSHSSRPSSAHSHQSDSSVPQVLEVAPRARPKMNPFGDAKPREVLLQEQGRDWRKIDMELERRAVDRPETEEEKILKEEIDRLKKEMEKEDAANANGETLAETGGQKNSLHEIIVAKERDLELLILELDDKIRFGQRAADRPGSGAGRVGFLERPPSRSNMAEESRNIEFADRPRSHGRGDGWTRSGDDRRAFQGGRERGVIGNREIDRSKSIGDRW